MRSLNNVIDFNTHYLEFLGIPKGFQIGIPLTVASAYRDRLLNGQYIYPVIFSEYKGGQVCSSIKQYYDICSDYYDGSYHTMVKIHKALMDNSSERLYDLKKYRRYSVDGPMYVLDTRVETLTDEIIEHINFAKSMDLEIYKKRKQQVIPDGRQFVLLENKEIAATGFVSDIYNNGANIVVYTTPKYRNRGYGTEVVKACVNWCYNHHVLPIYLVEENNGHSIKLAESIGFELQVVEHSITGYIPRIDR